MASIPLPALDVKVPQQQNPIQSFMQMKAMMQDQQLKGIQVHQAQRAADDQKKLGDLMIKHQGNLDKVIAEAPEAGVSPNTVLGLQQHAVDVKQKTADLVKSQGVNAATQADLLAGAHDTVSKAPADQRPQVYQAQLAGLNKAGVDVSTMPQEYPGDEQFKMIGAVVQGHKQQVEAAIQQQEADAATLRAKNTGGPQMAAFNSLTQPQPGPNASAPASQTPPPDQIPTGPTPSSLNPGSQMPPAGPIPSQLNPGQQLPILGPTPSPLMQQSGITRDPNTGALVRNPAGAQSAGPMSPLDALRTVEETKQDAKPDKTVAVDKAAMDAWLAKPQNKGKDAADYEKWKAGLAPAARFSVEMHGVGAGLTDSALDNAAEKYWSQGVLPAGGRGPQVMAQNQKIMNRATELHAGESIVQGTAAYAANKASLVSLQKNFDNVSAFESTAGKNLDVFLKQAKKVVDSGSPWINTPLRAVDKSALGSEDQAAFNAARVTALTEIAKVLNSSNASGVLSDSARHEVEGLIGPDTTLKQAISAANILKQDMANRHQSYSDHIKDIQSRMPGKSHTANQDNSESGVIYARDPQGVLHKAPAGSALPKGWKTEKAPVGQ